MLERNRDVHHSGRVRARSGVSSGYRPKFTITPYLSAQIAGIEAMRQKVPSLKSQITRDADLAARMRRHGHHQLFTLERVLAMANGEDFPVVTESGEQDVLDYYAMRYRRERLSGQGNWASKQVLHLHKLVTAGEGMDQGRAGEYRSISVRARRFVPPPPTEVPQLMLELLEWWNTKGSGLPAVITSAVLHYRISAVWQLYRSGFRHMLSLNGHYWGKRRLYYGALRAVSRHGEDLTRWLEYCAGRLKLELHRAKQVYRSQAGLKNEE